MLGAVDASDLDLGGLGQIRLDDETPLPQRVEELERGMCSVAAPLGPSQLAPTMSIGATGSLRVFTPTFREQMGRELICIADELVGRLGWDPPQSAEAIA